MKRNNSAKISRGFYNYRGYNIVACGKGRWTIFSEDDSVAAETKTLRAMFRKVDGWIMRRRA